MTTNPHAQPQAYPQVTQDTLIAALSALGLSAGMGVMVHSSLKAFGHVVGGPAAIINALQTLLTPAGTLLLPSFNHNRIFDPGGAGIYDPRQSPTFNGAIPDYFWRLPGVERSLDPTHPIAAWGQRAHAYTRHHHRTLTMGLHSPLGRLYQDDGYGLLLGVTYDANTFHHVVETAAGAPCLGLRTEAYPVRLPDGRQVLGRTWGWREASCPFTDLGRYHAAMTPYHRQTRIGMAQVTLFKLSDCYQVVSTLLHQGQDGYPPCSACPIRPRRNAFTVPSDWDALTQQPVPASVAWTY